MKFIEPRSLENLGGAIWVRLGCQPGEVPVAARLIGVHPTTLGRVIRSEMTLRTDLFHEKYLPVLDLYYPECIKTPKQHRVSTYLGTLSCYNDGLVKRPRYEGDIRFLIWQMLREKTRVKDVASALNMSPAHFRGWWRGDWDHVGNYIKANNWYEGLATVSEPGRYTEYQLRFSKLLAMRPRNRSESNAVHYANKKRRALLEPSAQLMASTKKPLLTLVANNLTLPSSTEPQQNLSDLWRKAVGVTIRHIREARGDDIQDLVRPGQSEVLRANWANIENGETTTPIAIFKIAIAEVCLLYQLDSEGYEYESLMELNLRDVSETSRHNILKHIDTLELRRHA